MIRSATARKFIYRAIALSCILLLTPMHAQIQAADDLNAIKTKFIGDYELVSYF